MTPLMPTRTGMVSGLDTNGGKGQRFAAYQNDCLFLFNVSKDKKKNYRLAKTFPASKTSAEDHTEAETLGFFLLTEKSSGRIFKYQQHDKELIKEWAGYLAAELKTYHDKTTGAATAKKLRTNNLFRKIKVSATLISAFASEANAGKARTLAELAEQRRLEDEEDIRLDTLEVDEEEAHVEQAKQAVKVNNKAAEKKKAERLAARADTTQLAAQIDEMQVLSNRTRFRTRIGFARRRFPPTHL